MLLNPTRFLPGDPNFSSVAALLHFDGTPNSTTITDQKGGSWFTDGDAKLTNAQSKFGNSSLVLDGAVDFVYRSHNASFNASSGPLTAEIWARPSALPNSGAVVKFLMRKGSTGSYLSGWIVGLFFNGTNVVAYCQCGTGSDVACIGTSTIATGVQTHIAAVLVSGSQMRIFVNGVLENTTSIGTAVDNTDLFFLGRDQNDGTRDFNGYLDEFRLTRAELYTSNFTPPSRPFPDF